MTTTQAELDLHPLVHVEHDHDATIQERFDAWTAANPWVMQTLERMVSDWLAAGHTRVGVKQCWEVIRWSYGTTTGDTFKANNNFTSRAARALIDAHPEWADAINVRELRAA